MTPQDIAELEAAAAGNIQVPGANLPTEVFTTYQGCNQNGHVGATDPSRPLDISKFNMDKCGIMPFYFDLSSSTITGGRTFVIGGNIGEGQQKVFTDIYGGTIVAGGLLANLDVEDTFGVNAADFNPAGDNIFNWLQDTINGRWFIASRLDVEVTSGSVLASALGTIRLHSLKPEGSWSECDSKLKKNFCDPCPDDSDARSSYLGWMAAGTVDAIAIDIPNDFVGTLEFCIYRVEKARNMTKCG